jgi:hypothetical protein
LLFRVVPAADRSSIGGQLAGHARGCQILLQRRPSRVFRFGGAGTL